MLLLLLVRRVRAVLGISLLACLVAGCEMPTEWSAYGKPRTVAPGEIFAIDEGTSVRLGRSGTRLDFTTVTRDTRCPADVLCIEAGAAAAEIRLHRDAADTTISLTIPGLVAHPYERNATVLIDDLAFKLLELTPYPGTIPESAGRPSYRALLIVEET